MCPVYWIGSHAVGSDLILKWPVYALFAVMPLTQATVGTHVLLL